MHLLLRRIPKSLLTAGVTAFLLGGTIGFAAAAGEPDGVPAVFGVAEPHGGDQWEYDVSGSLGVRGTIQGTRIDESIRFEGTDAYRWLEASVWQDADGAHHAARLLVEDFELRSTDIDVSIDESMRIGYVVPHDGDAAIGLFSRGNSTDRFPVDNGLPFVLNEQSQGVREQAFLETTYGEGVIHPFCGFRSTLQGGEVELEDGVTFGGECSLGELEKLTGDPLSDVYLPHSVDEVRGMQAVRFQQTFSGGSTDLWMARHVPYPVKSSLDFEMEVRALDPEAPPGLTLTLRIDATLSGFRPGSEPFAPETDVPAPRELPSVPTAPRQLWGPEEQGVEHPYPLSYAFRLAHDDDSFSGLRDFMARHDDAVATHAAGWTTVVDEAVQHHWIVQVDDGDDAFSFHTWQTTQPPDEALAALGLGQADVEHEHEPLEDLLGPVVDPADVPDRLPTVAGVAARWSAMFPGEGAADAWSFTLACAEGPAAPGACRGQIVAAGMRAGSETAPGPAAPVTGDEGSAEARLHMLGVDVSGHPVFVREASEEERYHMDGLLPLADDAPEDSAPSDPAPVATVEAGVWRMPAAATAGVAGAALLAGLGYWLWPILKGGGVGLFSRVHGPKLLEHPVRAELMEMVRDRPGIHYQGLVRGLGRGRGVVEHHMRKLQQSGFIVVQRTDGLTCFFPKGEVDRHVMAALPTIKTDAARRILSAVTDDPSLSQRDLAARLGLAPSTVSHHVRRLRAAGLVERARTADGSTLRATGLGQKSLAVAA